MENNTSNGTDDDINSVFERDWLSYPATVICAVSVTLFSVYLMTCILRMKVNTSNSYIKAILNLAVIDTTVSVALICRAIFERFRKAEQTYETCAVWSYIFITLQSISYFHILAIGIFRYRMIRHSNKLVPIQRRYSHGVKSLAIWIAVILIALPPFVIWMRPGELMMQCRIDFLFNTSNNGPLVYLLILLSLPWLGTNILYISIVKRMCCHSSNKVLPTHTSDIRMNSLTDRSSRRVAATQQDTATAARNTVRNIALKREKNITRTISILLVAFNISILSYILILIGLLLSRDFNVPGFVFALTLLNNLSNPFVYAFSIPTLGHEMKNNLVTMWTYCRGKCT